MSSDICATLYIYRVDTGREREIQEYSDSNLFRTGNRENALLSQSN